MWVYRDLRLLLRIWVAPPSPSVYVAIQLITAASFAVLCVAANICGWPRRRLLTLLLALGRIWMTVLGPSTRDMHLPLAGPKSCVGYGRGVDSAAASDCPHPGLVCSGPLLGELDRHLGPGEPEVSQYPGRASNGRRGVAGGRTPQRILRLGRAAVRRGGRGRADQPGCVKRFKRNQRGTETQRRQRQRKRKERELNQSHRFRWSVLSFLARLFFSVPLCLCGSVGFLRSVESSDESPCVRHRFFHRGPLGRGAWRRGARHADPTPVLFVAGGVGGLENLGMCMQWAVDRAGVLLRSS